MLWCCCGQTAPPTPILETTSQGRVNYGELGAFPFVVYPTATLGVWSWLNATSGNQHPLVRVNNLFLNQGVQVTTATLVLRGSGQGFSTTGTLGGTVNAWNTDDAPDADPGWTPTDVQNLPRTSSAALAVDITAISPSSGAIFEQINVTAMINQILLRPGWTSGNSILFILDWDSGPRADGTLFSTAPAVENGTHLSVVL